MGKRFVSVLGDSISTFEGYNPRGYSVFYDVEAQEKNGLKSVYDTWWAKVNQTLNAFLCVNNSFSGSTVSGKSFPAGISEERLRCLKTNVYNPDIILIFLGFNDFGRGVEISREATDAFAEKDTSFFEDAYDDMLQKLRRLYPATSIVCGTLMRTILQQRKDWRFPEYYAGIGLEEYNKTIRRISEENCCYLADVARFDMRYETLDGSHPTAEGHITIARAWIQCLNNLNLIDLSK